MQLHLPAFQQGVKNMLEKMVLRKLDIHMWKEGTISLTLHKINSKWCKAQALKILEENITPRSGRSNGRSKLKYNSPGNHSKIGCD